MSTMQNDIRDNLVQLALEWQTKFGVAPPITSTLSEYDAAMLVGMPENEYSKFMQSQTAVQPGYDFIFGEVRYQVKGNRPSGKPRSKVTRVPKASNCDWDILVWVLYNKEYEIQEAWSISVDRYKEVLREIIPRSSLSPEDYRRKGTSLLNKANQSDH